MLFFHETCDYQNSLIHSTGGNLAIVYPSGKPKVLLSVNGVVWVVTLLDTIVQKNLVVESVVNFVQT